MKTNIGQLLLLGSFCIGGLPAAHGQSASVAPPRLPSPDAPPPPPAPEPSAFEQWSRNAKQPTDWLRWGMDLRARDEYYNHTFSLTDTDPLHEQNVARFRGRLWTAITPITDVTINARLSAEPRYWTRTSFITGDTGMEWRYGILDNLNVRWSNILDQPLSITVGRQDIMLGDFWDWWLVADGTPRDGSWSFYFDSARVTYEAKDIKTRFDLIGIHQRAEADHWVPVINSQSPALVEQDEQGVILYASNRSLPNTRIDGYFIYKQDDPVMGSGNNADIYTAGAKIVGHLGQRWSYSLEGAYQFGSKNDPMVRPEFGQPGRRTIDAFGVNSRISYQFNDRLNNQAHLIYEYLSGDDPDSPGRDQMFDVLWGRWPRWSELYIYSYTLETGGKIAQMNNLQRVGAGWTLNPWAKGHAGVYYNALFAPQDTPTRNVRPAAFSGDGNFRGHYLQATLRHDFTSQLRGHLWGELVWQGDYYAQRNLMSFLRAEVSWTF